MLFTHMSNVYTDFTSHQGCDVVHHYAANISLREDCRYVSPNGMKVDVTIKAGFDVI